MARSTTLLGDNRIAGKRSPRYSQITLETMMTFIDQRWHHAVRIELEVFRLEVILALAEIERISSKAKAFSARQMRTFWLLAEAAR